MSDTYTYNAIYLSKSDGRGVEYGKTQYRDAIAKELDSKIEQKVDASDVIDTAHGGTGLTTLTGTDYTTSRVRGISIASSTPSSISNGHIVMVYS